MPRSIGPALVSTSQPSPVSPRRQQARRRSAPRRPARRIAARQASWNAATSMSAQLGSYQAPVHCSRRPGISRSSSARSRCTGAYSPLEVVGILHRARRTARSGGPRRAAAAAASSLPGQVGIEHRLRCEAQPPLGRVAAEARLPEGRRAPGRMAAAQVLGLDQHHAASSPASRAPRLAPAIPPPTIRTSTFSIARAGYGLESRAV